jgi:hypothetical protein
LSGLSGIGFAGTARGFREYVLPALKKAAMLGLSLKDDQKKVQRMMRQAKAKDALLQIHGSNGSLPAA